jgi:cellobiose phosphorylase
MYAYLTGSASWYILTMLTQVFGVRGLNGDMIIEPKLSLEHFSNGPSVSVERNFAGRRIKIKFLNPKKLPYGQYRIVKACLNSRSLPIDKHSYLVFSREVILGLPAHKPSLIEIHLA